MAACNSRKHDELLIEKQSVRTSWTSSVVRQGCNNYLFRLRMLSACGLLMYCSTICFQRRRHSQPLKKLWTFLTFCISIEPSVMSRNPGAKQTEPWMMLPYGWNVLYKLPVPWDMVLWTAGRLAYIGTTEGLSSFFRAHNCNENHREIRNPIEEIILSKNTFLYFLSKHLSF